MMAVAGTFIVFSTLTAFRQGLSRSLAAAETT
jgi:hypothetical protein